MDRVALVDFLEATPTRLRDLASGLSPDTLGKPIGDGWTPLQVLGHLRDSMAINQERFQRIVNEDQPLISSWDQDATAERADYNAQSPDTILADLTACRTNMVDLLRSLDDQQWQCSGRHEDPQWGNISIEWLANHLREHETEHLADMERAAQRRPA